MTSAASPLSDPIVQKPALGDVCLRLRSFSATTWFGKPHSLTGLECARNGWTNTGPDQLTCLQCGSQILCKLPANPWSPEAAGIVKQYARRLVEAHSPQCPQRTTSLPDHAELQTAKSHASLSFPVLASHKLSAAFSSRLQGLQQLQTVPDVACHVRSCLAAAAASMDASLLQGLAAILQVPLTELQQDTTQASCEQRSAGREAAPTMLPRHQSHALIALCGWQTRMLLPAKAAAATTHGTAAAVLPGVAHLLPQQSKGPADREVHGVQSDSNMTSAGSTNPNCVALQCELCDSHVGLWELSCSGPFYAQQLASQAMKLLSTVSTEAAAAAAQERTASPEEQCVAAPPHVPCPVSSTAPGDTCPSDSHQQQAVETSPEAVFSSLSHTIAGGSLLTAGASGASNQQTTAPDHTGNGCTPATANLQQQQHLGPFGAGPQQPATGRVSAVSDQQAPGQQQSQADLFSGLQGVPVASVFGSPPPVTAAAQAGPFGAAAAAAVTSAGQGDQGAAGPVFGLQAFHVEEQRVKRRRSSAAAQDLGMAADAVTAPPAAGGELTDLDSTAASLNRSPGVDEHKMFSPPAAAPRAGSSSSGGGRSFSKQRSVLAAAAADTAVDWAFDPIRAHKNWCPWVVQQCWPEATSCAADPTPSPGGGGLGAALRLGWSATVMAVQEELADRELQRPLEQQQLEQQQQADDGSHTAAVLTRARQVMDMLQSRC